MLHLLDRGQVAPRTEGVHVGADGVYDVVDAMLYDDVRSAGHVHLDREPGGSLQPIGLIGDAVILSQDAGAADGASDDGHVGSEGQLGHVVGPCLGGNGVTVADDGMVLGRGQHVDGIEKVEPVGAPAQVQGQFVGLGKVAVGVVSFREWSGDEGSAVHLGVAFHVQADIDGVAPAYGIGYVVALLLLSGLQGDSLVAAKGDGHVAYEEFVDRDRLGTRQVGEPEAQPAAAEAHPDGIAQGQVLGVDGFAPIGDGGSVAPAGHPLVCSFCHGCSHSYNGAKLAKLEQKQPHWTSNRRLFNSD